MDAFHRHKYRIQLLTSARIREIDISTDLLRIYELEVVRGEFSLHSMYLRLWIVVIENLIKLKRFQLRCAKLEVESHQWRG